MDSPFDLRRIGRRLLRLFLLLTVPYALICAFMYAQQRSLVYLPQYTQVPVAQTDFALQRGDVILRGWLVNPGRERALLYFGGNAESVQVLREPMAQWFPGYSVYLLAYRGYGASDGEPTQSLLIDDAVALFDHLRGEDAQRPVAAIGRSLGSGVAAGLASQRSLDRLVLVTPFDSLVEVAARHYPWLPVHWLMRERYPSVDYLAGYERPLLLIRARRDEVIPTASTDRLLAALPRSTQVLDLPTDGHNFDLFGAATAAVIADFLTRNTGLGATD